MIKKKSYFAMLIDPLYMPVVKQTSRTARRITPHRLKPYTRY